MPVAEPPIGDGSPLPMCSVQPPSSTASATSGTSLRTTPPPALLAFRRSVPDARSGHPHGPVSGRAFFSRCRRATACRRSRSWPLRRRRSHAPRRP
jgi:hypothetical protein